MSRAVLRTSSSSTTDPSVNGVADVATTKIKVVDDEDDALRLKPRYRELPHSVKISGISLLHGFMLL